MPMTSRCRCCLRHTLHSQSADVDIYGQVTPAKAVGGDLYDFYIRDNKLIFCIGDVSGGVFPRRW